MKKLAYSLQHHTQFHPNSIEEKDRDQIQGRVTKKIKGTPDEAKTYEK